MTGVEKVREWAEGAMSDNEFTVCVFATKWGGYRPFKSRRGVRYQYCLAYGAYLRGLIEAFNGGYDRHLIQAAIAAWKEVLHAS
jgi:hypothetical protein